jgi:hypothetical protein
MSSSSDPAEHDSSLFLDDESDGRHPRGHGRVGVIALVCVVCAALAVPVGLALTSGPSSTPSSHSAAVAGHGNRTAMASVLSALSATTDSGSFNITYEFSGLTPPTTPTTTTTTCPNDVTPLQSNQSAGSSQVIVICASSNPNLGGQHITGQGTVDTNPYAMVATSQVPGLGTVTLRADDTDIWEMGGGDYGLSPGSSSTGPGSPLSGFASLVEGTLGPREGASAMLGLASPTGYLNLDEMEITGADFIGTSTVDGTPVDQYRVFLNPSEEADLPNLTSEQSKTISQALALLKDNGYLGDSVVVSIDGSGYIRQTDNTATYADGSVSTSETTFSDFGCAGTVLMPGQQGSAMPPAGCVSPDTGGPLVPVTTTTGSTTTTTSSAGATTSTSTPSTTQPGAPTSTSSTSTSLPATTTTAPTSATSTTSTASHP